jgi:hypothetical protein
MFPIASGEALFREILPYPEVLHPSDSSKSLPIPSCIKNSFKMGQASFLRNHLQAIFPRIVRFLCSVIINTFVVVWKLICITNDPFDSFVKIFQSNWFEKEIFRREDERWNKICLKKIYPLPELLSPTSMSQVRSTWCEFSTQPTTANWKISKRLIVVFVHSTVKWNIQTRHNFF